MQFGHKFKQQKNKKRGKEYAPELIVEMKIQVRVNRSGPRRTPIERARFAEFFDGEIRRDVAPCRRKNCGVHALIETISFSG